MIEIKYTESDKIRLTITPNRVTLKIKNGTNEEILQKYVDYTNQIIKDFKPTKSYRGTFRPHFRTGVIGISLQNNNRDESVYFELK